jgi:hypothetical protein
MSDRDQALRLLSEAVASLAEADESLAKLKKDDGVVSNLERRKAAVAQELQAARAKLEASKPLLARMGEAAEPTPLPDPDPDPDPEPVPDPGPDPDPDPNPVPDPPPAIEAADQQSIARMRAGEQLQIVRLPDGGWRVDFRQPGNLPIVGEVASAIHSALRAAEALSGFPQLPDQGNPLTDDEIDALTRLQSLGAGFEGALRWEANGTHADHNFHGPEKRQHWAGEKGLLVEPIEWLERELAQEPPKPPPGPDTSDAEHQAAARVFASQPAQLHRPRSSKGIKWAVLGPKSKDDGGATHGHGDTIDTAIEDYESKTGDTVSPTAAPLSTADTEALEWYAAMSSVDGPAAIRLSRNGNWHGEYWRQAVGKQHEDLGQSAGIAGVIEFFKSRGL